MNPTYESNKEKFLTLIEFLSGFFSEYSTEDRESPFDSVRFFCKADPAKGFYIRSDFYRGKIEISVWIKKNPNYRFGDVYNEAREKISPPVVGFSIDRPAEQIAKGIKTRFFPDFEVYYAAWLKTWQINHDYKNGKENTIRELAEVLGVKAENSHTGEIRESLSCYSSPHQGLKEYISDVRVSSSDSVEIKTQYLSKDKAVKLLEFLKTL